MLDIVSFTFLGAVFFCTPVNVKLCFGIQLNYLETVWSFCILLLRLGGRGGGRTRTIWFKPNYSSLSRQDPSVYSIQCSMIYEIYSLVDEEIGFMPGFVCIPGTCLFAPIKSFFLQPQAVFSHACIEGDSPQISLENSSCLVLPRS